VYPVACCQPQTEGSKFVQEILQARYRLRYLGVGDQCRHYKCSHPPCGFSQHSWGNAIDILSYSGDSQWRFHLDIVANFLWSNRRALGLHGLIWWGKSWFTGRPDNDHWDHIHISFEPHGISTPSCWAGAGHDSWRHPSWAGGFIFTTPAKQPPPMDAEGSAEFPPPTKPNELPLQLGDRSDLVRAHQIRLNIWFPNDLPLLVEDGVFGPKTQQWVFKAQRLWNLEQTGIIDQALSDLLFSAPPVIIPDPPPPIVIPPLPTFSPGYYGDYRKFFYPREGGG
jgi:hypothetical protein